MPIKDVFPRLDTLEPGFLRKDSISFAKANGMYSKELENLSDKELLNLSTIQIHVLPVSLKRIETKQNRQMKDGEGVELISNFESYATPKVTKFVRTLGNITDPHYRYKTPVAYLGNNAILKDLTTWRQPGKQSPDMPHKQLSSQEGGINSINTLIPQNSKKGKKVSILSLSSVNKKVYDKFADHLTKLWARIKTDSPTHQNFENSHLSSNTEKKLSY